MAKDGITVNGLDSNQLIEFRTHVAKKAVIAMNTLLMEHNLASMPDYMYHAFTDYWGGNSPCKMNNAITILTINDMLVENNVDIADMMTILNNIAMIMNGYAAVMRSVSDNSKKSLPDMDEFCRLFTDACNADTGNFIRAFSVKVEPIHIKTDYGEHDDMSSRYPRLIGTLRSIDFIMRTDANNAYKYAMVLLGTETRDTNSKYASFNSLPLQRLRLGTKKTALRLFADVYNVINENNKDDPSEREYQLAAFASLLTELVDTDIQLDTKPDMQWFLDKIGLPDEFIHESVSMEAVGMDDNEEYDRLALKLDTVISSNEFSEIFKIRTDFHKGRVVMKAATPAFKHKALPALRALDAVPVELFTIRGNNWFNSIILYDGDLNGAPSSHNQEALDFIADMYSSPQRAYRTLILLLAFGVSYHRIYDEGSLDGLSVMEAWKANSPSLSAWIDDGTPPDVIDKAVRAFLTDYPNDYNDYINMPDSEKRKLNSTELLERIGLKRRWRI